jgi:hypothetical protein
MTIHPATAAPSGLAAAGHVIKKNTSVIVLRY